MKTVLSAVCTFTLLACAWMFVMFFVLRHPGFIGRAGVTALLMGQSAATLFALGNDLRTPWWPAGVGVGACVALLVGLQAFRANESAADWEGYVAIISLALVFQGVLTLATIFRTPSGT